MNVFILLLAEARKNSQIALLKEEHLPPPLSLCNERGACGIMGTRKNGGRILSPPSHLPFSYWFA